MSIPKKSIFSSSSIDLKKWIKGICIGIGIFIILLIGKCQYTDYAHEKMIDRLKKEVEKAEKKAAEAGPFEENLLLLCESDIAPGLNWLTKSLPKGDILIRTYGPTKIKLNGWKDFISYTESGDFTLPDGKPGRAEITVGDGETRVLRVKIYQVRMLRVVQN